MELKKQPMVSCSSKEIAPDETTSCGTLPACAPLAVPFVPMQKNNPAVYAAQNGVIRGTMFPGLDLPFMGKVNETPLSQSQLHELQTLGFAMVDLGEYLDTHTDDTEAFKLFQFYAQLYQKGREAYEKAYGPLTQASAADADCYHWMSDPWPWEISANEKEG